MFNPALYISLVKEKLSAMLDNTVTTICMHVPVNVHSKNRQSFNLFFEQVQFDHYLYFTRMQFDLYFFPTQKQFDHPKINYKTQNSFSSSIYKKLFKIIIILLE
jgi:hypothetical protein